MKKVFPIIIILFLSIVIGFFVFNKRTNKSLENNVAISSSPELATPELTEEILPTIKSSEVPDPFATEDANYFEKYDSFHVGVVGDNGKYTKIMIDDIPVEKPISISYSNEHHPLNLKSDAQLNKIIADAPEKNKVLNDEPMMQMWLGEIEKQSSKYGQIARQYLPYDKINNYYEADVDNDGIKEKLITICGITANHCSDRAEIIKGNEIIFFTQLYTNSIGIIPAQNGFYVSWTDENSFIGENGEIAGLCCELSHNKTLFLYKSGKFTPVKQWKIDHIWKKVIDG